MSEHTPDRGVVDGRRVPFAQVEIGRMRDPDVPMQVKALYCLLVTYADYGSTADREVWPSRETLAADLGIGVSTVDRWLSRLVDTGWIEVRKRTWDSGLRRANIYVLKSSGTAESVPPKNVESDPPTSERSGVPEVRRTDLESVDLESVDLGTADADLVSEVEVEGHTMAMPTRSRDDLTSRILEWADVEGLLDDKPPRDPAGRADIALRTIAESVGDGPEATKSAQQVCVELVQHVTGEQAPGPLWGHLGRLVKLEDPREVASSLATALRNGAGLTAEHAIDPLALTKYAKAVLNGSRSAA